MKIDDLKHVVKSADKAINMEDFDSLMKFYREDAVLVVKPGTVARGREEIRRAFSGIAEYFNHSLNVRQDEMAVIEAGDTALVIARAVLTAEGKDNPGFSMERIATYVFRKSPDNMWQCVIDNSYGAELLTDKKP